MKFIKQRAFADPDAAVRKLVEIANAVEAVHDGRIYIERVNAPSSMPGPSCSPKRTILSVCPESGHVHR